MKHISCSRASVALTISLLMLLTACKSEADIERREQENKIYEKKMAAIYDQRWGDILREKNYGQGRTLFEIAIPDKLTPDWEALDTRCYVYTDKTINDTEMWCYRPE